MPSSEKLAQFVQALSLPRHPGLRTYQFGTYDLSVFFCKNLSHYGVNVASIILIILGGAATFLPESIPLRCLV